MIAPARTAAFTALRDVNTGRADLPAALAAVRPTLQDERDRALATDLVTGTLRWQRQLDYLIEHFAKRPLAKLDSDVLQILRLGAYQLLHLDRVPAAAAVNDAVAMTRRARKTSAAGLVNAVLRAISRNSHRLPLPPRPPDGDPLAYLEVSLSHPAWLAHRWLARYGFDAAEKWERFNNEAAPLTIRVNTLKTDAASLTRALAEHGVSVEPARYAPHGLIVTAGNPLRTSLAGTGQFFLQDEASQLVALLGAPEPGMRVLDTCASPGGKTTAMAAMAGDRAEIVATDVRPARVALLRETVAASGAQHIRILQADLEAGLPFEREFDVVFVDAPCSGLGTVRRDPDIRWRRTETDLEPLAQAQANMIRNAAGAVRPGGRLIYSTCSSEPEENDRVVAGFLAANGDFSHVDLRAEHSSYATALAPVIDDAGMLRTLPHTHGLEAFYGAVLRRVR
ncbi:MAG TPA: 16S rRNA (cytosine(967)-C(5))-methyltransferase RsmB [Vicinamibacterales bacterium]|nr:16S rRNA (cytosine(967)-C(5))-methyltransferase RsmB [Vicinamibacterales bacterium]